MANMQRELAGCSASNERLMLESGPIGEVAEWSIVPDSKSGVLQGTEGSNPSLSASNSN